MDREGWDKILSGFVKTLLYIVVGAFCLGALLMYFAEYVLRFLFGF